MGLTGSQRVLWKASGLTIRDLHCIALDSTGKKDGCRVDVDINNVACTIARGKSPRQVIDIMATYLHALSLHGSFIVTAVLVGEVRPDCKRDSQRRKISREISKVDGFFL